VSRFHFIGGLGCLHLGPDAFNLRGAQAASRNIFAMVREYIEEADQWRRKAEGKQNKANDEQCRLPETNPYQLQAKATATARSHSSSPAPATSDESAASIDPTSAASKSASRPSAATPIRSRVCTPSSRRNQMTRGAKCLECNLAAGDATRQRIQGKGNPFQCLDDDEQEDEQEKEEEKEEEPKARSISA
jgi:hypothetical protein